MNVIHGPFVERSTQDRQTVNKMVGALPTPPAARIPSEAFRIGTTVADTCITPIASRLPFGPMLQMRTVLMPTLRMRTVVDRGSSKPGSLREKSYAHRASIKLTQQRLRALFALT